MTALRDPFEVTHKKDIKNKDGVVVAQVDYVGWSQSADRLDETEDIVRWSFFVVQLGPDWALGDLATWDADGNERHFQNIGYAENAEAGWKKEVLKDAVSDAFKRCAALAGVARYLYDKDSPSGSGRGAPPPPRPSAAPTPIKPTVVDDPYADLPPPWEASDFKSPNPHEDTCPDHDLAWVLKPGGVSKTTNKPYDPFWACPSTDRPFCKNKPSKAWQARHEG